MKKFILLSLLFFTVMFSQNNAINFSDYGNYVELNNSVELSGEYSIIVSAHFPLPSTPYHNVFLSGAGEGRHFLSVKDGTILGIYDTSSGNEHWHLSGYDVSSLSGWHELAAVSSNGETSFYINGEQVGSPVSYSLSSAYRYIGNYYPEYYNGNQWAGMIDNLLIYNVAVEPNERYLYTDNLIAFYDFNEGTGNTLHDRSVNENHGTIYQTSWVLVPDGLCEDLYACNSYSYYLDNNCDYSCHINGDYGLYFNGNSVIDMGTGITLGESNEMTVEAIIKNTGENNNEVRNVFRHQWGEGNWLRIEDLDQRIKFNLAGLDGGSDITSDTPISFNDYYHVVATWDGETSKIYINGELDAVQSSPDYSMNIVNDTFFIGAGNQSASEPWIGVIENMRVWDKTLDATEISTIYSNPYKHNQNNDIYESFSDGLLADWRFNKGQGGILYDHSGNQNHGEFSNIDFVDISYGCIDEFACNYNADANADDASCTYDCYEPGDYSLYFEDDDFVETPFGRNILLSFTIESKFRFNGDPNSGHVAIFGGESSDFFIGKDNLNSRVYVQDGNGTGAAAETNLFDGNVHHIAYSFKDEEGIGGNGKLYVDGELLVDQHFNGGTGQIWLGHENEFNGYFLDGWMSNIRISDINRYEASYYDDIENLSNVVDENTLALYSFISGEGDVLYDFSGNTNNSIINGASWKALEGCSDDLSCFNEQSMNNDGSCNYSCFDNNENSAWFPGVGHILVGTNPTGEFSISTELKPNFSSNPWNLIFNSGDSNNQTALWFGYNHAGFFRLHLNGEDNYVDFEDLVLENEEWSHVAIVWDGVDANLYLNNQLSTQKVYSGTLSSINQIFETSSIGYKVDGGNANQLNARLDNLIIYDREISEEEINSLYNRNGIIDNDSLLLEYKFNSIELLESDDYFIDYSGNSNHGENMSVELSGGQPVVGCQDENACNYVAGADFGNDCFFAPDYGWCDCEATLPDQCGECGGYNDCFTTIGGAAALQFNGEDNFLETPFIPGYSYPIDESNLTFNIHFIFEDTDQDVNYPLIGQEVGGGAQDKWMIAIDHLQNNEDQERFFIHTYDNTNMPSQWVYSNLLNLVDGQEYTLTIIKDNNNFKFYLNGLFVGEDELLVQHANFPYTSAPLQIGAVYANGGNPAQNGWGFFKGTMHHIAIWNKALSNDELQDISNPSLGIDFNSDTLNYNSSSNIFGYYKFNEGAGNTVYDYAAAHQNYVEGCQAPGFEWVGEILNVNKISIDSQYITSGEVSSIPIFLEKQSEIDGMIFNINSNSGPNPDLVSLNIDFEDYISGLFNYTTGTGSVVISGLDGFDEGETILLGHLHVEVPAGVSQGEEYILSLNNVSGTNLNYELVDIVGTQSVPFTVITAPPEFIDYSDSYCLIEGQSTEDSFYIIDDLNMDISLEYNCPSYVNITFNEETHIGLISINSTFGDQSGECTLTATTDDDIEEVSTLIIPININHYPTLGIEDGFNVIENELFTFNMTPSDIDGDNLNVEYLGGSDYVSLDGTTLSIYPPFGAENSEICFSLSDDGCPAITNQQFCYDVLINHQPLITCDTDVVHIPETDVIVISCIIDDGGDFDIDLPPSINEECSYITLNSDGQDVTVLVEPDLGDSSCILDLTIEDNTGLSNTTQIDVQVYKTYLVGDVRPQSGSEIAGEFGDGIIVAPDVVNILKVATGVAQSPTLDSDLFDAFDSSPQDIDVDDDGDLFDQSERGGDQSIDASDVIVSLLTATNIYEQIIRVEDDYPYSTPIDNSRDSDDNRTNDLITMESEVVRDLDGVHVSIPIRLERGSVENLTSAAIGFELVSDDDCIDFVEMEFISDYSAGIMNVQADNKLSILMYNLNPISSNVTIQQLGTLRFTLPLASSGTYSVNGLIASGSNDAYDVINIDFSGNSLIEFDNQEIIQKEDLSYGSNLRSFYSLPDDKGIGYMMSSIDDYVTGVIGEGVAASPNPVLGWVGSLQEVDKSSGYWIIVNDDLAFYESPISSVQTYEEWETDINFGSNLIAYPCLKSDDINSNDILPIPNEFEQYFHNGIIGEGVAATYNPTLGWVGSLNALEPGKGYWMKSNEDFSNFHWDCPELSCEQTESRQIVVEYEMPEELNYTQSSQQAFYFISEIDLNQTSINEGDWIVAMYDNNIVGARAWNGLFTDIPVMGHDGFDYSISFLESGKVPTFKLYKDGQMIDLFGDIPEFSNLGIHMISLSDVDPSIPSDFILEPAYPNPFNPSTTISYGVSEATNLNVSVYNIQGQQVDVLYDGFIEPGYYQKTWNASDLSSGIYVVRMSADTGFISNQKIVLVK